MLRVRLTPLRADGAASAPSDTETAMSRADQYDKMEIEEIKKIRGPNLWCFAVIVCCFNGFLLVVSAFVVGLFENGQFTEYYNFKNPLTQTAAVWVPYTNASQPSNALVAQSTCTPYVSRDFYKPNAFVQHVTFVVSTLNARYLLLTSMVSSFVFQFLTCIDQDGYYEPFTVGNSHITGYLERSISMPLYVVILLTQLGMHDMWMILSLMFNAWASMLFSFFAEILFQGDGGFLTIGASRFKRRLAGDTVKNGGGFLLYTDGNVHYHALAMLFSLAHFTLVAGGVLYNVLLTHTCLPSQPAISNNLALPIYSFLGLYGLVLIGQTFNSYIKAKPSTIKQERADMISDWKESKEGYSGTPTPKQTELLMSGIHKRVQYSVWLEFYYGILDLFVKCVIFASFFLFKQN